METLVKSVKSVKSNKPRSANSYRVEAGDKAVAAGLSSTKIRQWGKVDDCVAYLLNDVWAESWGEPKKLTPKQQSTKPEASPASNAKSLPVEAIPPTTTDAGKVIVKFVPFYFRDFWNDPRRIEFDLKEQQQFLFLLVRMMMTDAKMPENFKNIARDLGMSVKEAAKLTRKLKDQGWLVATGTGHKLLTLHSPRLLKEYERATVKTAAAAEKARQMAAGRWPLAGRGVK